MQRLNTWLRSQPKRKQIGLAGAAILLVLCCLSAGLAAIGGNNGTSAPPTAPASTTNAVSTAKAARQTELVQVVASLTPLPTYTPAPTHTPTYTPTAEPTSTTPTPSLPPEATAAPAQPTRVQAQVTHIVDGDTIHVSIDGHTYPLRYIGIDTPEPDQPYGPEATEANRQLVEGQTVYLETDVNNTDPYDRLLRYVYLQDGTFVNARLVRQGHAIAKEYPPDTKHAGLLAKKQKSARDEGLGLWALITPTVVTRSGTIPTSLVVITHINYNGDINPTEPDEYCEITNQGLVPVNLNGWRLNAGNPGQDFNFPDYTIQPGQSCRIYTNQDHPEHCGFSFHSNSALWSNSGDCGYLHKADSGLADSSCY